MVVEIEDMRDICPDPTCEIPNTSHHIVAHGNGDFEMCGCTAFKLNVALSIFSLVAADANMPTLKLIDKIKTEFGDVIKTGDKMREL